MTERYVLEDRARNTFSVSRETLVSPAVFETETVRDFRHPPDPQ